MKEFIGQSYREEFVTLIESFRRQGVPFGILQSDEEGKIVLENFEALFPFAPQASIEPHEYLFSEFKVFEGPGWYGEVKNVSAAVNFALSFQGACVQNSYLVFNESTIPLVELNLKDIPKCISEIILVDKFWIFIQSMNSLIENRYSGRVIFASL